MSSVRWWCAAGTWSHDSPPPGFDVYVVKTATIEPRTDPCPLILRALPDGGYLNRIGVRNPGIDAQLANLPKVWQRIVSVLGFNLDEWAELARRVYDADQPGLELNLSCPNAEHDAAGTGRSATFRAVHVARRHFPTGQLGAKLSPTAPVDVAKACMAAGADYLTLTNTLGTPLGGLSGRPLRALALDCIARIAPHVDIPIIGGGGILERSDGQAYLDAGATELFQGTANMLAGSTPEAA